MGCSSFADAGFYQIISTARTARPAAPVSYTHLDVYTTPDIYTAIFFVLSGTGKTTLSTDPKRLLIGDDEHGWDDNGVFNFEGGCYAKVINLDKDSEPDIYNAIKRNALLENVTLDAEGHIDFADKSVTENKMCIRDSVGTAVSSNGSSS